MMRFALFIVILAVLLLIAAIATGLLHVSRGPSPASNTINAASPGVPPRSFDVETGSVHVGSRTATVKVPKLEVTRPAQSASNQSSNSTAERR